jgi:hypothetical protein
MLPPRHRVYITGLGFLNTDYSLQCGNRWRMRNSNTQLVPKCLNNVTWLRDIPDNSLLSTFPVTEEHWLDQKFNRNPWQRGYSSCHLFSWDTVKHHLFRYVLVLNDLNSIIRSITIPAIKQKKKFSFISKHNSVPCILHTLNHALKFKLHDFKNYKYRLVWNWDLISLTLQNLGQLSTFII